MRSSDYRADIDGLRAIAVLSVLLYHLGLPAFSGGFIGVDVFFVISGFLITRLLLAELDRTGKIRFSEFYTRRARRLFPALFFTLVLSFIAASLLFSPPMMQRFGASLISAVSGVSNLYFLSQAGYFESSSQFKPLLHTWSLGVEEQFYLLWPALLLILHRKFRPVIVPVTLCVLGGISLYLNYLFAENVIWHLPHVPEVLGSWFDEGRSVIFFFTPFRIFEFAIGALMVWLVKFQPGNRLLLEPVNLIGLGLVFFSMVYYTDETLFPGVNTLVPCIGAAMVIYGGTARYSGQFLSNRLAVSIGLISYSLYLIHWPIISFFRYYKLAEPDTVDRTWIFIVSMAGAALMYRFIEQPFRYMGRKAGRATPATVGLICILLSLLISLPAAHAWVSEGWGWRTPNAISGDEIQAAQTRRLQPYRTSCRLQYYPESPYCEPEAPLQVLILGDSHHYVAYNALEAIYGSNKGINLMNFSSIRSCYFEVANGALVANGFGWKGRGRCQERAAKLNDVEFTAGIDVLVVSSFRVFDDTGELVLIDFIKSRNSQVKLVILGTYISLRPLACSELTSRFGSSASCKDAGFVSEFDEPLASKPFFEAYSKYDFLYIDVVSLLCEERKLANCKTEVNGVPMFYDGDHYTLEFSRHLGSHIYARYSSELEALGFRRSGEAEPQ